MGRDRHFSSASRSHETPLSPGLGNERYLLFRNPRCGRRATTPYPPCESATEATIQSAYTRIHTHARTQTHKHNQSAAHAKTATMPGPFSSKSFSATLPNSLAARYRKSLQKHPFLLFGLPFLSTIVLGSFMLTPATALRYERYDRKNQQITQEQAMGLRGERRKVNMKDEYYVRIFCSFKTVEFG